MQLIEKSALLQETLGSLGSLLVAYSGGTDSAFLAYAAHRALNGKMLAVIADSASLPRKELAGALAFTAEHGIPTYILQTGELEKQVREVKGVKVLAARVSNFDRPQLRAMVDSLRNKWTDAVIVLGTATDDTTVSIVAGVTKDLTSKVHAGKLAGAVALAVGGKGGGRPDMAEAGGKDPSALAGALADVYSSVEGML